MHSNSPQRNKSIQPFPGLVHPGKWSVKPGTGHTSLTNLEMYVPSDNSDLARYTRLHEMLHAKFTPKEDPLHVSKKRAVSFAALQVAEDARIQSLAREQNITLLDEINPLAEQHAAMLAKAEKEGNNPEFLRQMALYTVATTGTRGEVELYKALLSLVSPQLTFLLQGAVANLDKNFESTVRLARVLDLFLPPSSDRKSYVDRAVEEMLLKYPDEDKNGLCKWAPMIVTRPPLEIPVPGVSQFFKSRRAPTNHGAVPRFMHRLADGNIFNSSKRIPSATVLLDASGSMSLEDADIEHLIQSVPGARVWVYSGDGDTGHLFRAAENGKRVRELYHDVGNDCDGPALRYMIKFPKPRYWISDGRVCHKGSTSKKLAQDCAAICRQGQILRLDSIEDFLEHVKINPREVQK